MGPEGCSGVSVEMSEMRVEQNSGTFLVHRRKTGRREEAIKGRLYDAYRRSGKSIDFIIDFIENADDEDDY